MNIECKKTGFKAKINFKAHTNDVNKHRIKGKVYLQKKKIMKLRGEWNGTILAERIDKKKEIIFCEAKNEMVKKVGFSFTN